MMAAPLRRVVDIVTETRTHTIRTAAGREKQSSYLVDYEVLECGHRRKPKDNAHLGGTDIGNAKRRRCEQCATETVFEKTRRELELAVYGVGSIEGTTPAGRGVPNE